jgi:hypothetical protein
VTLAIAVGAWLLPTLLAIAPSTTQALGEVTMDWRVALFGASCAAVSSLAAGLLPALNASDTGLAVNAAASRSTGSRHRQRWRRALLVAQTAMEVTRSGATMNRFVPGFAYITLVDIENQPTPDGSGHTVGSSWPSLFRVVLPIANGTYQNPHTPWGSSRTLLFLASALTFPWLS